MDYLKVNIITSTKLEELISNICAELDCGGIEIDDPNISREHVAAGDWDAWALSDAYLASLNLRISLYLPEKNQKEKKARLETELAFLQLAWPKEPLSWSFEVVKEEDWDNNWRKFYKPFRLGQKMVIKPSWEEYLPQPEDLVVELDPGMAFGTGDHATTALCAELLEFYAKPKQEVLDIGCGSGILAIIAAKLGANYVEALDIDPMAVEVAQANSQANKAKVFCHVGEITQAAKTQYDIIVANIVADIIAGIAKKVANLLKPGGVFIAGGIICGKQKKVLVAAEEAGLIFKETKQRDNWHSFVFKKK